MGPLVVLPTYNEAATIEEVLRKARTSSDDLTILVVDDASPDGTADIARAVGDDVGGIEILSRTGRKGLGSAYRDGFAWGLEQGADAIVEMDSDLSHDPSALPELLAALDHNDLVIGSRYVPGGSIPQWGLHRRLLSRGGNLYSSMVLGVPVRDMTSGFRAYRASLLSAMDLDTIRADGYGFQIEMTYRAAAAGARIAEVPIRFVDRTEGESKMSGRIVAEAMLLVTGWGLKRLLSRPGRSLGLCGAAPKG